MSKSATQLPVVPCSHSEVMSGALPSLFARMAVQHGPILKHVVQSGPLAGEECVYIVGPDANRFVLHTHRDHFSHNLGWTPLIGESLGKRPTLPAENQTREISAHVPGESALVARALRVFALRSLVQSDERHR
jgi:hypothetical protein